MTGAQATQEVEKNAYFKLTGVCDGAGDEFVYYEKDVTNISMDDFTHFVIRWKTSVASSGLGARVRLVFTSGTEFILGSSAPEFSSTADTWKLTTGTITSTGKTLDKIRLYADDDPDSLASGTYYVYYDYILLYNDDFEFPYVTEPIELSNVNREGILRIPGRVGDVVQYMGMDSPLITIRGEMDSNANWGTDLVGAKLYEVTQRRHAAPWRFFQSDLGNFPVEIVSFIIRQAHTRTGGQRTYELVVRKLDEYCGSNDSYSEYYNV